MNTNPAVLPAAALLLDLLTRQFFTGMLSAWTRCAKLAGIKAATATNTAPCSRTELSLENIERWHSKVIAAVLPFAQAGWKRNHRGPAKKYESGDLNLTDFTQTENRGLLRQSRQRAVGFGKVYAQGCPGDRTEGQGPEQTSNRRRQRRCSRRIERRQ